VCCTSGLLTLLDDRELRGVLAHELAHIHRRGTLVSSTVATIATVMTYVAQFRQALPWSRHDRGDGGRVGPVAAGLMRLAVSRTREYAADAAAARLTGDPLGLAAARRKLDAGSWDRPLRPEPGLRPAGALMIVDPFRAAGGPRLLATHPPTAERIMRLESLAGYRR
jgi:heat shock protein HtpX